MNLFKSIAQIESKEDFIWGAVFGAAIGTFSVGYWAFLTTVLCSLFWAMGGDKKFNKLWRRIGCAATSAAVLAAVYEQTLFIYAGFAVFAILSIGYGLPDPPERVDGDEGSPLGMFALALADNHYGFATVIARGTIIAASMLVYASVFVISFLARS